VADDDYQLRMQEVLFAHKIESLEKLFEAKLEERDKTQIERERALALQAREYERRLDDLNHAHDQAVTDRSSFVSVGAYNSGNHELEAWKRTVDIVLARSAERTSVTLAIGLGLFSVAGLIVTITLQLTR